MSHLDYALAHTDWHAERQAGDGDAISRWTPYDKPVVSAQKELSKLPVYQRVYQSLKTRALGVLPADLNLRDQVGPTLTRCLHLPMTTNWLFHSLSPATACKAIL